MSRYYHVLSDDGRRCRRCKRRSQIFGNRDVTSNWIGYCRVCNMEFYEWYLKISIRLCDRGCRGNGLDQMLQIDAAVDIVTNFVLGLRRSRDVLMACSIQHVFALVQLSWLSCPLNWLYEDTDSEAEEERYRHPILRTLREPIMRTLRGRDDVTLACSIYGLNGHRAANDTGIERPCLLDLVCTFLYCHQARIHIARTCGYFLMPKQDNDETNTQYFCIGTDDTADETNGLELDWSLFTDGDSLWLWRASTEECFYIDRPPAHWRRYCCTDNYWWHNVESSAWFYEPKVLDRCSSTADSIAVARNLT